jgi:molybdate transport system ATP-binding protein
VPAAEVRTRVARVAQTLGLSGQLDRLPRELSGGERQRVALGRALAVAPDVLLLDEPLGALDPARRDRILPYVLRARQALGVPMVWVTHDADELAHAADRALILDRGRTIFAGPTAQALALLHRVRSG